jgi:hypothetical protein
MRTTIDIDDPILKEIKRLQKREVKALGRLVSDLLAQALVQSRRPAATSPVFQWFSRSMHAKVDLGDKQAVLDAMNELPR